MLKPGALWVPVLTGKLVITSVVPGLMRERISPSKSDGKRTRFARSFKFGTRRPLLAVDIHSRRPLESNDFNAVKTYEPDNRSTRLAAKSTGSRTQPADAG